MGDRSGRPRSLWGSLRGRHPFAEECLRRGAQLRLLLAQETDDFVRDSVRHAGEDWVRRFHALCEKAEVAILSEQSDQQSDDISIYARTNLWIINSAQEEAADREKIYALLVWDEKPTGDGPGGTSDFEQKVRDLGGLVEIINPTKLCMNQTFEYVERRLEPQQKWHNKKATWNKCRFYTAEVATLLAGAAIPIVNLWVVKDPTWAGCSLPFLAESSSWRHPSGNSSSSMRIGYNTGRWPKRSNGKRNCTQLALAITLNWMKRGVIDF